MAWLRCGCALFVVVALGAACSGRAPPKKVSPEPAGERLPPGFKLDLPTAPIVPKKVLVPAQYPDGAYSVHGLLTQKDALLGKDVTVSGFIIKLHVPTEKECEAGCTPAHLYLADAAGAADGAKQLLVADFEDEQVKELSAGGKTTVVGNFVKQSQSRFSRTEGLVSFKSIKSK